MGANPNEGFLANTFDQHTGRLTDQTLTRQTGSPTEIDHQHYDYDLAGNITRQIDTRNGSTSSSETQCYGYDTQDQLTAAWTATDNCTTPPTDTNSSMVADNLGVASAYWTSWDIFTQPSATSTAGERQDQIQHAFTGGPPTNITTSYTYNGNGAGQPHTLTATAGGSGGPTSYGYDTTGNMTTRNAGHGQQTLSYNDAGQLTQISSTTAGTTTDIYDADGNLLIQQDPAATTLYLPGEQLVLDNIAGTTTGTRYYPLPGGGSYVRTGSGTNYQFGLTDQHATPTLYIDNLFTTPSWTQTDPYGNPRGPAVTAPDNHGFLNKPVDTNTGLTRVGARNYDPTTGQFTTDDPVLETTDPNQLNGYAYAANNPITSADPSGLDSCATGGQGCVFNASCQCYLPPGGGDTNNRPTTQDTHNHCDAKCHAGQFIVMGDPGNKQNQGNAPWQLSYMRNNGYNGPVNVTYGDVDAWLKADPTSDKAMFVCEHILNLPQSRCGDPTGQGLTGADKVVIAAFILQLLSLLFEEEGELAGLDMDPYDAPPPVTMAADEEGLTLIDDAASADDAYALPQAEEDDDINIGATCNSFTPNTPVLMADGTTKPIKDVKVGDKVEATDPDTGKTQPEPVTLLHNNQDTNLTDLVLTVDGDNFATLHTTSEHLFWDQTTQHWATASNLHGGDQLRTLDSQIATVSTVILRTGHQRMLNLTVARFHTYYVIAGNTPVLVHNTSCRTFGYLSPSGRLDIPNTPGVYRIEMNDGKIYVGKATDIHNRIHGAFRDGGALNDLGYTSDQVRSLDWMEMPGATDAELFQMENQWIDYEGGLGNLANRVNSPGAGY